MYGIFHILFLWIEIHEIRTAIYTGSPIQVLGIIFIYYMLEYEIIKMKFTDCLLLQTDNLCVLFKIILYNLNGRKRINWPSSFADCTG